MEVEVEPLLAFAAALVAFRLAGSLALRWRATRAPQLAAWSAALLAYSLASGALAWGAAAGWSEPSFRLYYTCGGLLTAALLGAGSLLLSGRHWAASVAFVYTGLALGVGLAVPLSSPVGGDAIPEAQTHLDLFPARIVAISTIRRRPLGNGLILAGVAAAAAGSAVAGLGVAQTSLFVALAAVLLFVGFRTSR